MILGLLIFPQNQNYPRKKERKEKKNLDIK
jgi:hypothetical protein